MRSHILDLILCAICIFTPYCVWGQSKECDKEYQLEITYYNQHILIYEFISNHTLESPYVDSAWITNADTSQIVMVVHEQPREEVNISLLDRGYYLLHAQISDCSYTKMFIKRGKGDAQDLMNTPPASPSATKILRDGQMFILLDNKIYNALGTRLQ